MNGFLVELSKAVLGICVPLAYYFGHSWVRDHFAAKREARAEKARLEEESTGFHRRISLKPNGSTHNSVHSKDLDSDLDNPGTDTHPSRHRVRGGNSSSE